MILYDASSDHKLQAIFHSLFAKLNMLRTYDNFCDMHHYYKKLSRKKTFSVTSVDL